MADRAKGGKKNRKHGRNRVRCLAYASRRQREKNKVRRLRKLFRRHPNDRILAAAFARYEALVRMPKAA